MLPQLIAQKLISENHPTLDRPHCINGKQRKSPCSACANICRNDVYSKIANPEWERCDNCGLCVSVCPSRCLLPPAFSLEKYLTPLSKEDQDIQVACGKTKARDGLTVRCLGALPWEWIASAALLGELTLYTGGCEECELKEGFALFEKNRKKAEQFLGDAYYNEQVSITEIGGETAEAPPSQTYSRREFFSSMFKRSKKVTITASSLIINKKSDIDGLIFRKLLHKQSQIKEGMSFSWLAPVFSSSCRVCGICGKLCPQSAISIDTKDGVSSVTITPWKCGACGLCQTVCPEGGIAEIGVVNVDDLSPIEVHSAPASTCEDCGVTVKSGLALCPSCASKRKRGY